MKTKPTYHLVIGLGRSGLSMAKFLHSKGIPVMATDIDSSRTAEAMELKAFGIDSQIGFHDQNTFDQAACLVPSPGIPLTTPYIRAAMKKQVPVKSELDIFYMYNTLPVIAITGTNGKTTVTTLLGQMLTQCGFNPFVCGNIGTPLVELFMSDKPYDLVVAEISSFQMDISQIFRPDVGVLLNISEDHLDRYESFKAYEDAKWRLFENQTASDTAVINQAIPGCSHKAKTLKGKILGFSSDLELPCQAQVTDTEITLKTQELEQIVPTEAFKGLPGIHNHENTAAALLAGLAVNAGITDMVSGIASFKNLPHRIEYIDTIKGVKFYNDSKATNTDAVIRAIQSFGKNIILILGGRGKGTDFSFLIKDVKRSVKQIIALGETKKIIENMFQPFCPVKMADTMKSAIDKAFNTAQTDDIVLLSPACASFDMYGNYGERGNDFKSRVHTLAKELKKG